MLLMDEHSYFTIINTTRCCCQSFVVDAVVDVLPGDQPPANIVTALLIPAKATTVN